MVSQSTGSSFAGGKPTWGGLKSGEFRTPLKEFVGDLKGWEVGSDTFGNVVIQLHFERLQVIRSDTPYPYPEETLAIKYSDRLNSAWGKAGTYFAEVLGMGMDNLDIDYLKGRRWHMLRHDDIQFGKNKTTGEPLLGIVWQAVKLVQPGEVVVGATGPAPAIATSVVAAPVPQTAQTAEQRALELLNGRNLADFFQVALADPLVRTDANLINQIINRQFVEAKRASGQIAERDDGVFVCSDEVPL